MCEVEFWEVCFKKGTSVFKSSSNFSLPHCQIGYLEGFQFVKDLYK